MPFNFNNIFQEYIASVQDELGSQSGSPMGGGMIPSSPNINTPITGDPAMHHYIGPIGSSPPTNWNSPGGTNPPNVNPFEQGLLNYGQNPFSNNLFDQWWNSDPLYQGIGPIGSISGGNTTSYGSGLAAQEIDWEHYINMIIGNR